MTALTSTATPTPTVEEAAATHLSAALPWFGSPSDAAHVSARETLIAIRLRNVDLADAFAQMPWVADGITEAESSVLESIGAIVMTAPELGALLLMQQWLTDGVDGDEWEPLEHLLQFALRDADFARQVASAQWVVNGVSSGEMCVLGNIETILDDDPETSRLLTSLPDSLADLTVSDSQYCRLVTLARDDFSLAQDVADAAKVYTGNLAPWIVDSLTRLAETGSTFLHDLVAQPWFADGLDRQEAAFVITLGDTAGLNPKLYEDLLHAHFVRSAAISLPLAGDVRIWAFQNTPFPGEEGLTTIMADTARLMEEFLRTPFPANDIILLVIDHEETIYPIPKHGYAHYGSHMLLSRLAGDVASVPHEVAHYYFLSNPHWLREGTAEFVEAYVNHHVEVETLADRKAEITRLVSFDCADYENIRHLNYTTEQDLETCHYHMGENFLLSALELIGEGAMSAALREIYLLSREGEQPGEFGQRITEEQIYGTFLQHTPSDLRDQFRNLYRRLHGGWYAWDDVDFTDDHGDDAGTATDLTSGEAVTGNLDYMFDFDYFRLQAEEGRNYRITVEHETLQTTSMNLYASDGRTSEEERWHTRARTLSGPQILWMAPDSGEFYVAVQNFGGESGRYTLTVTAIASVTDDYGNNVDTATVISPGETIAGIVDGVFDRDNFQFHAEDGQMFTISVRGEMLSPFRVELFLSDGITPAVMDLEDMLHLEARGGGGIEVVDVADLPNRVWDGSVSFEWVAPISGDYNLVVSGADEDIVAYALTVTQG